MRVLVTGAGGMLGRAVVAECRRRGWEVAALGRQDLDVSDLDAVRAALWGVRPDAVVNCAAYTDVDRAEAGRSLRAARRLDAGEAGCGSSRGCR